MTSSLHLLSPAFSLFAPTPVPGPSQAVEPRVASSLPKQAKASLAGGVRVSTTSKAVTTVAPVHLDITTQTPIHLHPTMVAPTQAGLAVPPSPASSSRTQQDGSRPAVPSLKTLSPGRRSATSSTGTSTAPSPTQALPPSRPQLSLDMRSETRSIDSSSRATVDSRTEKRLPQLPSPLHERGHGGKPWALGAYDNKLVSIPCVRS